MTRFFSPILAGATLKDRLVGCLGACLAVIAAGLISSLVLGRGGHLPLIVAPIGASAVLLFIVPASPLAQPWPIIGGNTISALVGVAVARFVPDPAIATGLAVALAILVMSLTRSLHPPGGAAALTAVIGGPAVTSAGYLFPFVPVAIDSILLVMLGILFHRLTKRAYPHVPAPPPAQARATTDMPAPLRVGFRAEDVDAALGDLNESFDIDRGDLDRILRLIETKALLRSHGEMRCADIMSRDVVSVVSSDTPARARDLLLRNNIRTLPVLDGEGRLLGVVGLRELARDGNLVEVMASAPQAKAGEPVVALVPTLTDGRSHAVVITDGERRVLGLITQTDLLAAVSRQIGRQ